MVQYPTEAGEERGHGKPHSQDFAHSLLAVQMCKGLGMGLLGRWSLGMRLLGRWSLGTEGPKPVVMR